MFGRFTGKNAPSNSLKVWMEEQAKLTSAVQSLGYVCDKPGVRRIPRDQIHDLIMEVNNNIEALNIKRDAFIDDIPYLKAQIIDSYLGDDCINEVREALDRWQPNLARMAPEFRVTDLLQGTGLVPSDEITKAVAKSEINTSLAIVATLEDELKSLFERCDSPLKDAGGLLEKLAPIIREFSTSPDLIKTLNKGLEVLKAIPLSKEGLISPEGQESVKKVLEIFEMPEEVVTIEPEEVVTIEPETGDTIVETDEPDFDTRPISEIMAEKYPDMLADEEDDDEDVF